jgi:hypothetical protein
MFAGCAAGSTKVVMSGATAVCSRPVSQFRNENSIGDLTICRKYGEYASVTCETPCGRSLTGIVGSNPAGGMDVSCVLSGRGLCVGLIIRPEEFDVSECDREASIMRPWPTRGCCAMGKLAKNYL